MPEYNDRTQTFISKDDFFQLFVGKKHLAKIS